MVNHASREASQEQRPTYPGTALASPPAIEPASQGAQPQSAETTFQLQYVPMPAQTSQQIQAMYPMYMPAGQASNSINMTQMSQALPMLPSAQSGYFFPQQQYRARGPPSMTSSRGNFTTAPAGYRHQYQALGAAGPPSTPSHVGYPGMPNATIPQFASLQGFQNNQYYYPDPASSSAAANAFFVPGQVPASQMHDQYIDPAYASQQMSSKPFATAYTSGSQSLSRGPPRKPRQSGHALWVGNLPPGASVIDLKDHFSREATGDIESVKLISKSNCAFVNYKTQTACVAAMQRFHDSRYNGIRLVCRLRRTSAPGSSSVSTNVSPEAVPGNAGSPSQHDLSNVSLSTSSSDGVSGTESATRGPARYFILKSLTLQDLEASISTGIWATQAHNEQALNAAFKSADNVYLIFSANKSGEYFGFARMSSMIPAPGLDTEQMEYVASGRNALASQQQQQPTHTRNLPLLSDSANTLAYTYQQQSGVEYAGPRSISTAATEWAPKGRIIDDLARGTIFWEADDDNLIEERAASEFPLLDSVSDQNQVSSPGESVQTPASASTATQTATTAAAAHYPIIARSPTDGPSIMHLSLTNPSSPSSPADTADSTSSTAFQPAALSSYSASALASASTSASASVSASDITHHKRSQTESGSNPPATLRHSSSGASQLNSSSGSDEASSPGNPFRIEWLSTRRVPFYRTRGLRNALNNNREVKIARDGTEVEAGVGGRLLVLFGGIARNTSGDM